MGSKARSNLRVILIGGSSHVGKSALARSLADTLGWRLISTDELARHPGRPWRSSPERVPDHVAEHYLTLPVDELIADVLQHYRVNVWPTVETLIRPATTEASSDRLILEGSALWPEFVASSCPVIPVLSEGASRSACRGSCGTVEIGNRTESSTVFARSRILSRDH